MCHLMLTIELDKAILSADQVSLDQGESSPTQQTMASLSSPTLDQDQMIVQLKEQKS